MTEELIWAKFCFVYILLSVCDCQETAQPSQAVTSLQSLTNGILNTAAVSGVPLAVTPALTMSPAPATQSLLPSVNSVLSQLPSVNSLLQPQLQSLGSPVLPQLQLQAPSVQAPSPQTPCTCGVFLTGQFVKGGNQEPTGNPALLHEHEETYPCNAFGSKQCTNKCLDILVKHLPNSPAIICGSIDRDCYKERAYVFVKNCNNTWVNTNLSAGREYCCKDGTPYKCPLT